MLTLDASSHLSLYKEFQKLGFSTALFSSDQLKTCALSDLPRNIAIAVSSDNEVNHDFLIEIMRSLQFLQTERNNILPLVDSDNHRKAVSVYGPLRLHFITWSTNGPFINDIGPFINDSVENSGRYFAGGAVAGLLKSARLELSSQQIVIRCVDLDSRTPIELAAKQVSLEFFSDSGNSNLDVAYRDGLRFLSRLTQKSIVNHAQLE